MVNRETQKSKRTNSMYFRVLISALSVVFVTVFLIMIIYLFSFFKNAENEYRSIVQASLHYIDLSFSQSMKSISTECNSLYNSIEGKKVRLVTDYVPMHAVKFVNDIRSSFDLFPYVHSVCMIDKSNSIVANVTNDTRTSIRIHDQEFLNMLEEQTSSCSWIIWTANSKYSGKETIDLLSFYYRTSFPGKKFYQGTCVINLDLSAYSKSILSDVQNDNTIFYIINSQGKIIAHSTSDGCDTLLTDSEYISSIIKNMPIQKVKINGEAYEINSIRSSVPGYYIIAQGDYVQRNISAKSNIIVIGTLILLIFLISAAALYVLCLRIFKPFNTIVDTAQNSLPNGNAGTSDIEILRNYYKELSDNIGDLKEKEERDTIVKILLKNTEVNQIMVEKKLLNKYNAFYAVYMHIGSENEFDRHLLEYERQRDYCVQCFTEKLIEFGDCVSYDIGFRRVMLILETRPEISFSKESLVNVIKQVQNVLAEECKCILTSFVSDRMTPEESSILTVYQKSENCMRTRRYLDDRHPSIVISEDETSKDNKHQTEKLLNYVKTGQRDEFSKALYSWLDTIKNTEWNDFYGEMLSLSKGIVNVQNINDSATDTETILENKLDDLHGTEHIVNWFLEMYDDAFSVIKSINEYSMMALMERVISYVDTHYDDSELNLNTLAEIMHISASYLGKNFRNFAGVGFTEYLNKTRMEHAKILLLLDSVESISDIARKVGYTNNAYFATSFKNYFGMSPSKFRAYCQREQL